MKFLRHRQRILRIPILPAALSFVGLANRAPSLDELHHRANMERALEMTGDGMFRDHSVRHAAESAPHGLLGPLMHLVTRRLALTALPPAVARLALA